MNNKAPGLLLLAAPLVLGFTTLSGFCQEAGPAAVPAPTPEKSEEAKSAPVAETKAQPAPATETTNTGADKPAVSPAVPEDPAVTAMRSEIARMGMERDRLMAENAIAKERLTKELAERRAELERQSLAAEEQKARLAQKLQDANLKAEADIAQMKRESEKLALAMVISKSRAELLANDQRMKDLEARAEIGRLSILMEQKDKEIVAAQYAERSPVYQLDPFKDGKLTISDRRIELNGAIVSRTADETAERIDYYNNKNSEYPIFIVIDNSPGGSVMAGYKILESMKGSKAPVYVVVKSFAASMAACITTLADRSFAYPNAVILHHQLSAGVFGNLTQQRESLEEIEQWWQRLAGPIAKKMGISTDDFIKRMYEKVSSGDWTEFADNAKALKWVDEVVTDVEETGRLKHPDLPSTTPKPVVPTFVLPTRPGTTGEESSVVPVMVESIDEKGRPFFRLPRPNPKDVFYLYNPDGYYRLP